jgi:hypothetical protein
MRALPRPVERQPLTLTDAGADLDAAAAGNFVQIQGPRAIQHAQMNGVAGCAREGLEMHPRDAGQIHAPSSDVSEFEELRPQGIAITP